MSTFVLICALPLLYWKQTDTRGAARLNGEFTEGEMLRLLRSRKLSVWEDVPLLREYIRLCGITQSECAARLGRSQSSVANRLRLLRLTDAERRAMEEAGLSERHARALLRLTDAAQRKAALHVILQRHLSVAETEGYVETLLRPPERRELGALLAEVRRLLDAGVCTDAEETVFPGGLSVTLIFSQTETFP